MRTYRVVRPEIIGIAGTQRGAGCTHLALELANYACRKENRRVTLAGFDEDGLIGLLHDRAEVRDGNLTAERNGICIIPEISPDGVKLLKARNRDLVILDLPKEGTLLQELMAVCDRRVILGSLAPWCSIHYRRFMRDSFEANGRAWNALYFSRTLAAEEEESFRNEFHTRIRELGELSDPDRIDAGDYRLMRLILGEEEAGRCRPGHRKGR